jgi:hypothetical protein
VSFDVVVVAESEADDVVVVLMGGAVGRRLVFNKTEFK